MVLFLRFQMPSAVFMPPSREKYEKIMYKKRAQALQSDLDNMRQEQQLEGEDNNDPISELIVG